MLSKIKKMLVKFYYLLDLKCKSFGYPEIMPTLKEKLIRFYYKRVKLIYPIQIPTVDIEPNLDFLLLELPSRYLPMIPNGLGYVHNILKGCNVKFQTFDLNIIFYHQYHSQRFLKGPNPPVAANGYVMKEDPWDVTNVSEWQTPEVLGYFWPQLEEIIDKIAKARPKAIGFSIHATNRIVTKEFLKAVRLKLPDAVVVVGGYDCVYTELGKFLFPDFDYMVIREAELTLSPLIKALAHGERPRDLPGILSRYDTPGRKWVETPLLADIDSIDYPKYEWADMRLYQTYFGNHLVPILSSRGCHWGKCTFCCESFRFRKRSPEKVVEEIEYMMAKGFSSFHFNESDVNGDPQNLYEICSNIIKRGLKIKLMGQLRVDKRSSNEFFQHLAKAGFTYLRFGVDGWSQSTLKLQKKGYTMEMIYKNLQDCHSAGIFTAVNMVIGVPGETEQDVDEMIHNLIFCKGAIDLVEGVNTLILGHGSEYFHNPDKYKIRFHGDKESIYREHMDFIPTHLWYSEDPYIDQDIRIKRVDKICRALYSNGINIGPFASRVVKNIRKNEAGARPDL